MKVALMLVDQAFSTCNLHNYLIIIDRFVLALVITAAAEQAGHRCGCGIEHRVCGVGHVHYGSATGGATGWL
jgi:hypothetical protein